MKKRLSSLILIFLIVLLLSIPVIMVFFYRREFENYEISVIDKKQDAVQSHVRLFYDKYGEEGNRFLQAMSSYMSQHSESGALIILDEDYQIILPEDPLSKEARKDLAGEFAGAVQRGALQNQSYFDTADGKSLRVSFSSLQREKGGILYIIAYYDTDLSSSELTRLEENYLQIAVFSCALFLVIVVLFYWNYYRYMQLLSEEILRIGAGDFSRLALPPSIGVTEKVRRSINTMMEQLQLSMNRRETLSRSVNHYIRNHLMAVDGYAQGIETGVFSPEDGAAKIRMESIRMEEVLHNFSVKSYIEERTMPERDEALCLADEIEECFKKYRYIADRNKITLSLLADEKETIVRGTKSLLQTILDNLMSNALRYASSKVTFSVQREADQITVRVEDDGKGISDTDMEHLFQPLFKGRKGNLGFGLPVAQDAARYMGGSLAAENRPEGGAVFILSLPAV
ncbi:MAG: HAMP domain-containing histidine kinase [Lachnospiraceae bacterium]|nr:HAMP domain-containing histidine kinase [Lachnospiraceae bacterium]